MQKTADRITHFFITEQADLKNLTEIQKNNLLNLFKKYLGSKHSYETVFQKKMFLIVTFCMKSQDCLYFTIGNTENNTLTLMDRFFNKLYKNNSDILYNSYDFLFLQSKKTNMNFCIIDCIENLKFWSYFFNDVIKKEFHTQNLEKNLVKMTVLFKSKFMQKIEKHCEKNDINLIVMRDYQ